MANNRYNLSFINLLQPNKITLGFLFLLVLLSSITPNYFSYTTKITWDEYHGIPYTFLKLTGCYGPCGEEEISRRYFIQEFDVFSLLGNIFIWYIVACLIIYGVSVIPHKEKIKAIVTGKK
jgi:hypothetical protein